MGSDPFKELMRDIVILVKPDGSRTDGIRASVQSKKITISDGSLPIEEGDTIERQRPGGITERFTVLDTGYSEALFGIPARFHLEVRKETAIPRTLPTASTTYNLNGPNSRVNHNSIDASTNIALEQNSQVFEDIRTALLQIPNPTDQDEIRRYVDEMEATQGSPQFLSQYQEFIQAAANHMTLVAPFLPALTKLLGAG